MNYSKLALYIKKIYKKKKILLHEPYLDKSDHLLVESSLKNKQLSTHGNTTEYFSEQIKKICKAKFCIPLNSGTSGLHLSLLANNVMPNDEVIIPSLSFIASANAILYCNAKPIFLDVEEESLGLDPNKLEYFLSNKTQKTHKGLINKKTKKKIKALIVIHAFGNTCKIIDIKKICKKYDIKMIEDAAEAFGSYYKEKHLGTFGDCGIISFNGNKIITTGAGGVLVTDNIKIAKTVLSKSKICKINHPYKFISNDLGYNYRMPSINASLGLGQLKKIKKILKIKRLIHNEYKNFINENYRNTFSIVTEPKNSKSNFWLNILKLKNPNKKEIDKIIRYLISKNIQVRPLWEPLHTLKYLKKFQTEDLKVTNKLRSQLILLPSGIDGYVK
jgi:dTDP-4-amino-4,6-dideoxygalactose transaminase